MQQSSKLDDAKHSDPETNHSSVNIGSHNYHGLQIGKESCMHSAQMQIHLIQENTFCSRTKTRKLDED